MTLNFAPVPYAPDLSFDSPSWRVYHHERSDLLRALTSASRRSSVFSGNDYYLRVQTRGFIVFKSPFTPSPLYRTCCIRPIRVVYNYQLSTRSTTTTNLMILHSWTADDVFLDLFFLFHTALHIVICFSSSPSLSLRFLVRVWRIYLPFPSPDDRKNITFTNVCRRRHTDNVFYGGPSKGSERGRV